MPWRWLDLDRFVDVERLRGLDDELRRGIADVSALHSVHEGVVGGKINRFFPSLPDLRYDKSKPALSKLRTLTLKLPTAYTTIHLNEGAQVTELASTFPKLMEFIRSLPFTQFGRTFIVFDDAGAEEPIHRGPVPYQEFLWFRTNLDKRFFTFDETTGQKHYFTSHTAWFDQHTYHGCDTPPEGQLQWSIRVDGVFEPRVREYVRSQFDAWTEERLALLPYFEEGRDLAPLFPELTFSPERLKEMVAELAAAEG